MTISQFGDWLYTTPLSTLIRETTWVIPNVQSVHIVAIAVVVGSALVTELRMAGVLATDRPVAAVLRRYLPWMKWALLVLLVTGLVLIVAEPGRTLGNAVFWTKMALVAGASLVTLTARRQRAAINEGEAEADGGKVLSWLMLGVWGAVIFCGRFIAYT